MSNLFFYYEDRGGNIHPATTELDDGVFVGGKPNIVKQIKITDDEMALSLDVLERLYPYE